ncbi:MAG: hypothetical protein ACM3SU_07045 [Acidobacteriota bacterium]
MKRIARAAVGAASLCALVCRTAPAPPAKEPAAPPPSAAPQPTRTPPAQPPPAAAVPVQPPPEASSDRSYDGILELLRTGATEEALLAKIRFENRRYDLTTEDVLKLRAAGASEAVVAAMLRSGR